MKKLLALLLALSAIVAFSACSKKDDTNSGEDPYKKDDTVITEVTDQNGDIFHFVSVDSETVSITKFDSVNDHAHEITIPAYLDGKAVVGISEEAFAHISNVSKVIFPSLDDYAAKDEDFDADEFTFTIARYAFRNCDGLTEITIPAYVTAMGESAFYGCANLATVTFAEGSKLETIPNQAFMNSAAIRTLNLSGNVTVIGKLAFFGCSALENVNIPEGVTCIGAQAFQNCTNLKTVSLPTTLAETTDGNTVINPIGAYAFAGSQVLYSVTYAGSNEKVLDYIASLHLPEISA